MQTRFLAVVALLIGSVASAGVVNERGGYVGGALGITEFDDDGAFSGLNFDDKDTSFTIYGGYRFLKYFSLEGRLMNLGSYTVSGIGSVDIDTTAATINAVGIIPFGQSGWELHGQLGLGIINLDVEGLDGEDESIGSAGIGIRFTPIRNMSITFQIDAYVWEDDNPGQRMTRQSARLNWQSSTISDYRANSDNR